jgi:hypothetical protein
VSARRPRLPALPGREAELAGPVRAYLEAQGYAVHVNPDGRDYFDVVARRGSTIGLVELKRTDWKHLLVQAVSRRSYGDWVAVVLPRRAAAERLLARAEAEVARPIGVWTVGAGGVDVLRAAEPWPAATRALFPEHRAALEELLSWREAGGLPEGATWGGFVGRSARGGGGRPTREWRLDEFAGGSERARD